MVPLTVVTFLPRDVSGFVCASVRISGAKVKRNNKQLDECTFKKTIFVCKFWQTSKFNFIRTKERQQKEGKKEYTKIIIIIIIK